MMKNRLLISLVIGFFMAGSAYASIPYAEMPLNKINYQMTVEKWAATDTAKVTISLDAALDKVGLVDVNKQILGTLKKMAPDADWHVTQFTRLQDKSGMEMVHVEAEARLPQAALAGLRDKAKSISKSGETYSVGDIDFAPTLMEMEKVHADARAVIYDQVKQEIARLNQLYPDQQYFLNQIYFTPAPPVAMFSSAVRMKSNDTGGFAGSATSAQVAVASPNVPVNAKVVESAQVVIAARLPAKQGAEPAKQ